MNSKKLTRLYSILLAICIFFTSVSLTQIVKVYAEEGGGDFYVEPFDYVENGEVDGDLDESSEQEPYVEPEPSPTPQQEEDPFDYNLSCYTPSISFGSVDYGDVVMAKQFNIVNVGNTTFPLTWEEVDPYTAFDVGAISRTDSLRPGDTCTFSVSPREGLAPGGYSARIIFYSANDFRRHHTATVDITITVLDSYPYITSIDVYPSSVTLPVGKQYRFECKVSGANGYDGSVYWSLTGNNSQGTTIDYDGTLHIGNNETASSFAVLATSKQDPDFVDRAVVTVSSVDHVVRVSASPSEGGAVAGGGSVRNGDSCSVSASANNNYNFEGWYEGEALLSTNGQFTLNNITSDRNLVAKFSRRACYVRTSVNDADAGRVTDSTSVSYGGSMVLHAKANGGYRFVGFVEDKRTISNSDSLELNNITSDRNITAVFERITCKVSVYVNPQDTGRFVGGGNYYKGTDVELKAYPYDGYEFGGWTVNGQTVSWDYTYVIKNIQNDVNVTANFNKKKAPTYKMVSMLASDGGVVSPAGESYITEGGSLTYNIVPNAGYRILAVAVDGKNIGAVASYTFNNIREKHSIAASFAKIQTETPKAQTPATTKTVKSDAGDNNANTQTQTQTDTKKKTEYNANTAAQGAVKSQKVEPEEVIPKEVEQLDQREYADDVVVTADETQIADSFDAGSSSSISSDSVMAKHDLNEETLRLLIKDNAVKPLLKEAYENGNIMITVNNSYAEDKQETALGLYHAQPSLLNFEEVITETLTEEEKYAVLTGSNVSFNVEIADNTSSIDESMKKTMQQKIGYKPIAYFDFVILKTSNGMTTMIENTNSNLEVVVPIPAEYRGKGKKFYIIRNHNGVVDLLDDIGLSDDTVAFRTDRFSQYAIAVEVVSLNSMVLRFAILAGVSLLLVIICCFNLVKIKRRNK